MADRYRDAIATYRFEGEEWIVLFEARSFDEAQRRVRAIRESLVLDGWPTIKAPAIPGGGFLVNLYCDFMNWRKGRRHG